MFPSTQTKLPVQISTPLGADVLVVRSLEGDEAVSSLFVYRAVLYSANPALDFTQIVGQPVTLTIALSSGGARYINGIVARFSQAGFDQRYTSYLAEIRPALWLLTMNADCRIFQNMAVPDIIGKVFRNLGFLAFRNSLTAT
jgi:type VI secretion system secreted protein VgrG